MILTIKSKGNTYSGDLSRGVEIGIPIQRSKSLKAWGLGSPSYKSYESSEFTGDVNLGGPCNVEVINFVPHTTGTHTECLGHITPEKECVLDYIDDTFYTAILLTLPTISDAESSVSLDFSKVYWEEVSESEALVIRSLPNSIEKRSKDYTSTFPAYIKAHDMKRIVAAGVKHLVIDLPSVDPESDGGALVAHRIFWGIDTNEKRIDCSITEFAYVPDSLTDGSYLLKLNISPFQSDAAPSRPTLYPLNSH